MKIILRLVFYCIVFFMAAPLFALTPFEESEAIAAFEQDSVAIHAVKQHNKNLRQICFINNIEQAAKLFKTYDSLSSVDPVCFINGKILHAEEVHDFEIENDHCVVTIQLRPGFAQFVASLDENFWGNLLRCLERYLLRSRSFTFVCDLADCDTVDMATLFFQAYSHTENGDYKVRLRLPLGIEITIPVPIKY